MTENELNAINDLTKCVRGISFQMVDLTSEVKEIKREVIETRAIIDNLNSKVSKKPESHPMLVASLALTQSLVAKLSLRLLLIAHTQQSLFTVRA